eukprot:5307417-Amphidinium_carterae.1
MQSSVRKEGRGSESKRAGSTASTALRLLLPVFCSYGNTKSLNQAQRMLVVERKAVLVHLLQCYHQSRKCPKVCPYHIATCCELDSDFSYVYEQLLLAFPKANSTSAGF